jgi:(p)ppGpp synthase/HD superfamily hydrolase
VSVAGPTRLLAALDLALELHGEQRRSGTEIPYIAHLMIVAGLVLEEGGEENDAAVALLHDAAEEWGDRAVALIRERFGDDTAFMVLECSEGDRSANGRSWRERKAAHLRHMATIDDQHLVLILLADKVHNARSLVRHYRADGDVLWSRFGDRSLDDQRWYFRELVALFTKRSDEPLVDDLREAVAEFEQLVATRPAARSRA